MYQTLIANKTAAQDSALVVVSAQRITFVATGTLGSGEAIKVQVEAGGSFVDLYQEGVQVKLDTNNNAVTVEGPGHYRVSKAATVAAAGAGYYS